MSDSATSWTVTRQASCPGNSPGKNTGVGRHVLLRGIFPTQGSNPHLLGLLHWQAGVYYRIPVGTCLLLGEGSERAPREYPKKIWSPSRICVSTIREVPVVNKAATSIKESIFVFQMEILFPLGTCPEVELLNILVVLLSIF